MLEPGNHSKIMALFDEKWQNKKSTIRERGMFMFGNDLLSDVRLVVSQSSDDEHKKRKMAIPAHKFVLSICSPVFYAMFCGEMAEKTDSIDLPDCEYEGVLEMLRYLYSEEVKLNESNVMKVLYVAKKYILPSLADECIDFLQRYLDPLNVFCVLSHAQQYDEKILVDRCWEVIGRETEVAVKSDGFATIERSLLESIIKRDSLTIPEVDLFKAVDRWVTKECERQGLAADGKVKRSVLGEQIVKSIRFPTMEEKEFASVVLDSKILTKEELCDLMKNFNGVLTTPVGFPEDERIGACLSCCRFGEFVSHDQEEGGWRYMFDVISIDYVTFWVDEDVMLHGIRFFGSKGNKYSVSMKIKDCQNKESFLHLEKTFLSVPLPFKEEKIYIFDVMFDPFVLKKDKKYVVKASIEGPDSCFGTGGLSLVQGLDGVAFYFDDYKKIKPVDATGLHCGQFAEFIYKPIE